MYTRLVPSAWRMKRVPRVHILAHNRRPLNTTPLIQCLQRTQWKTKHALQYQHRLFSVSSIPPVLLPPLVFIGLLISLWTWKSLITILFQDKIIYMPYMPPFARSEKISTYIQQAHPVTWKEQTIHSLDGTKLALAIGTISSPSPPPCPSPQAPNKEVIIAYFQGNGSSTPPRIPLLSSVLKLLQPSLRPATPTSTRYTIAALSYRGYWTSSGHPSQRGIQRDARAFLSHLSLTYPHAKIILWGQSVGAGIACVAAAEWNDTGKKIEGLVLETPFTSIKAMLLAVYESRWLPYRYLGAFLWNKWDAVEALKALHSSRRRDGLGERVKVLLLPASRDELVPQAEVEKLEEVCRELGFEVERFDVLGAYHTEATTKREGRAAVAKFVKRVIDGG